MNKVPPKSEAINTGLNNAPLPFETFRSVQGDGFPLYNNLWMLFMRSDNPLAHCNLRTKKAFLAVLDEEAPALREELESIFTVVDRNRIRDVLAETEPLLYKAYLIMRARAESDHVLFG